MQGYKISRDFYTRDVLDDNSIKPVFKTGPRIGIDYAGDYWKSVPWRYYVE